MPWKDKEKRKVSQKIYRDAHRQEIHAKARVYTLAHREERKVYTLLYRQAHPDKLRAKARAHREIHRNQLTASQRARYQALIAEAFRVLGHICVCPGCGVSETAFLTIDHINGRPKGLRRNGWKEAQASGWDKTTFQIMCANCNHAKSDRGFCPVHQTDTGRRNGHNPGANVQQSLWPLS